MNSKYILVNNPIIKITKNEVEFRCSKNHTVTLNRQFFLKSEELVLWKLTNDGIEVMEPYVSAYHLNEEETEKSI